MSKILMRELKQVNVKRFSSIYHGNIIFDSEEDRMVVGKVVKMVASMSTRESGLFSKINIERSRIALNKDEMSLRVIAGAES